MTIVVRRVVRPGREGDFEAAMRRFTAFALLAPGNLGIHVIRPRPHGTREYIVVDRFADAEAREAFAASAGYKQWMSDLRSLSEADPYIEQHEGLASWFTVPGQASALAPPRWKMALATFVGVYPLTSSLPLLGQLAFPQTDPLLVNVGVTGLIVALLTWLVMPQLTRLLRRWLFAGRE